MSACEFWPGKHRKDSGRPVLGRRYAHRVVYEAAHGALRPGLVVHHNCHNPLCVNVEHLQAMTRTEHMRHHNHLAQGERAKTHCAKGHAFDAKNTRTVACKHADGRPYVRRVCRICCADAVNRYRAKGACRRSTWTT